MVQWIPYSFCVLHKFFVLRRPPPTPHCLRVLFLHHPGFRSLLPFGVCLLERRWPRSPLTLPQYVRHYSSRLESLLSSVPSVVSHYVNRWLYVPFWLSYSPSPLPVPFLFDLYSLWHCPDVLDFLPLPRFLERLQHWDPLTLLLPLIPSVSTTSLLTVK